MTFSPDNSLGSFLPETVYIPKEEERFNDFLKSRLEEILRSLNRKDIGSYEQLEQLCGQKFFGATPQDKRSVFRKVFSFGAIAAGATLNIAHGITGLTELTNLYGTCITAVVDYRPIPFVSVTAVNQGIQVLLAGVNISITNGAGAPNITSGIIVCEFVKQ